MRIALVGYGKMGKIIDEIARKRGHQIVARLKETPSVENLNNPDVVIEFSNPKSAYQNIKKCLELRIPVICGTTGWLEKKNEIEAYTIEKKTAFLYASNFSLGVNLFFALNKSLAKLMDPFSEYEIQLEEFHHIHKLDKPSGTAIALANDVIENSRFKTWKLGETKGNELGIFCIRENEVPGVHTVYYRSELDEIQIKHKAFNRKGFALGAVVASEWINGKKGVFTMNDVLGF